MNHTKIDNCVEALSHKGCTEVTSIIDILERGEVVDDMQELNAEERQVVLRELKAIMAVYQTRK